MAAPAIQGGICGMGVWKHVLVRAARACANAAPGGAGANRQAPNLEVKRRV